jgi:hypothetical protein
MCSRAECVRPVGQTIKARRELATDRVGGRAWLNGVASAVQILATRSLRLPTTQQSRLSREGNGKTPSLTSRRMLPPCGRS